MAFGIRFLYFTNFEKVDQLGRSMPAPTQNRMAAAAIESPTPTATVEPTPTQWPTPIIIEREIVREIPIEVTREVSIYRDVPVETIVEVERIVQVTAIPFPTITPVPLAPGTVEICASVEGATGLYIGGYGIVSGGCRKFTFSLGQTSIQVQVNK